MAIGLVHQEFPAGAIITNGLGLDAGDGTLITTSWHLLGLNILVSTEMGTSGGSYPLALGEIKNLYRPVPPEMQPYLTPYNYDPFTKKSVVSVKVEFGKKTFEKNYLISKKRAKTAVSVLNFVNATKDKVSTTVKNLKAVAVRAIIRVKNFGKRR